jgi:hypothetical protein
MNGQTDDRGGALGRRFEQAMVWPLFMAMPPGKLFLEQQESKMRRI